MTARQRWTGVALVVLGCLGPVLAGNLRLLGKPPLPVQTAQEVRLGTPEPPLADAPLPPMPIPVPGPAPHAVAPFPPPSLCPVDPPTPAVALRMRVPACIAAGQELEYRICVENCSRAAAHHVLVRNPVPPNARFVRAKPEPSAIDPELLWQLGTLPPGACCEICLVLCPTGMGDVKNCARVQFEHGQCVCTRVVRPELTLRKCGPAQAVLLDTLSYELVVCNTGAAPATGVLLTDTLPEGLEHASGKNTLTWELGTLAPGQQRCVRYQVIARKPGAWTNHATVTAAGGLHQEAISVVTVGEARLELLKVGPEQRYLNRPATYLITATNPGVTPLTNVAITDPLPDKTAFVSATDDGKLLGHQVQWTLGTLPPGGQRTVQVVLRATEAGEVVNRAMATADHGLHVEAMARTRFEGATGLTADIEVDPNPVEVGKQATYKITVENQGDVAVTNLRVTATIPEQMQLQTATGPVASKQDGQTVTFDVLPSLAPHKKVEYDVIVKALKAGDVRFRVAVSADQLPAGPVHREEGTTIVGPPAPPAPPPAMPPVPPPASPQSEKKTTTP
jgi:uncharacterized repeat protein (TIGR01451 family)